jgi:hypothetical protein
VLILVNYLFVQVSDYFLFLRVALAGDIPTPCPDSSKDIAGVSVFQNTKREVIACMKLDCPLRHLVIDQHRDGMTVKFILCLVIVGTNTKLIVLVLTKGVDVPGVSSY